MVNLPRLLDLTPPCLIKTPKPVHPISTPWFLDGWLDTINHPGSHCRSRSAPCDTRGSQHRRRRLRSCSNSHSHMSQRKSFTGSIGRPRSEQFRLDCAKVFSIERECGRLSQPCRESWLYLEESRSTTPKQPQESNPFSPLLLAMSW
jgi:hypothetical protein